jgi:hypothetical protein
MGNFPPVQPSSFVANVNWDGTEWVPVSEVSSNQVAGFTATVSASAQQAPNGRLTKGITLAAPAANAAVVYVGGPGVTTTTGFPIAAGDTLELPVQNMNQIYFVGTAGDKLSGIGL